MPCLEWGLDTCSTAGQEEPARLQALNYLGRCKRCDYASEVEDWLGSQGLKFIPRWSISHSSTPQSILNQDFYVFSGVRLSKFKLNTTLLNTSSSSAQNIDEPNTSIHQWSHFFEMNGSWETNTATQDPVHLLTPTQMSWGSSSLSSPAHTLWLRSQYQLTAIDTHTSKTNWIFTYPTDSKGVLLGCDQLSPLTDHVLCVGSKEAIVLNESGELVLKLPCVNKQCGEHLFSSNEHLALYDFDRKSLHIYQLYGSKSVDPNFIGEGEVRPAYQSISLPSGLIDAQIDQEILFVTTPNFVQATNLVSGTVIWTLPLHLTARLLITPSVIFALSKNSLNALSLQTGKTLWTSTFKFRSSSRKRRSFDTSPDRLPSRLIKRLGLIFVADHLRQSISAYQEESGTLQWNKSTPLSWPLELDHLDRQLIIISPQKGEIIGVHHLSGEPQWRFKRPTFLKAKFTRQWASITEKDRLSLYSVQTIRSQMTPSKPKPSKSKPKPSKSKMPVDDKALLTLTQELPMTSQDLEERCINTNQSACVLLGEQLAQNGEDFSMFEGLWEQGCIWGESRGCLSLGELAMKGTNSEELGQVPQMKRAFSLFKRALALNSPEAALHLGYLYQDGKGVLIDYYKAQRSFRIACDQGLAEGCGRLAHLYELGLGSKSKPIAALRLYRDACTQKDQWSCEQKKRLNK